MNITFAQFFFSLFLPKVVMSGPFKDMKYLSRSTGSVILPKLIGTYEDELHDVFSEIKTKHYECFIDIGAAEGYYAVGFKKFLHPEIEVIAFESKLKGRKLIKKLAFKNDIEILDIRGTCNTSDLVNALNNRNAFLLIDIEGGEFELLDPQKVNFENSDLLVEIHYFEGINRESELKERFERTHAVNIIQKGIKELPDSVAWNPVIRKYGKYVTNEFRAKQKMVFSKKQKV